MTTRHVSCRLSFVVEQPAVLALQIAVARPLTCEEEALVVTLDGEPVAEPPSEVGSVHGGRIHLIRGDVGRLDIAYRATVRPPAPLVDAADGATGAAALDVEALEALRQSRYCPSDLIGGFARSQLADLVDADDAATRVAAWVHDRLTYDPMSTGPFDTAVETLATGAGVCRDFAHLAVALCRGIGVPARLAAVYAPDLEPPDFHAVVEARQAGRWVVLDPTRLAPRSAYVRIATGRDAADTAFAETLSGVANLIDLAVEARIDGEIAKDDHEDPVELA